MSVRPSALALTPLLLFLALFFGAGLYYTAQGEPMGFYQLRAPVAILPALALGLWLGARLWGRRGGPAPAFDGNPRAQAALGISPREMAVLAELAAGHSNKEIAARLHVSPNTVKTHVARLFEKLGARRRTDALRRARELGLVP